MSSLRVGAIQYPMRTIAAWPEFANQVEQYTRICSDYRCDIALFPELFTLQLLSIHPQTPKEQAVQLLDQWTDPLQKLLLDLAQRHSLVVVGGSHIHREADEVFNDCFVAFPDGKLECQRKIHATPNESWAWQVQGGSTLPVFLVGDVKFAVNICYDVEFPELARHQVDKGCELLLVPFCTDERRGYFRVRHCAQARAIENQMYVAMAGTVGCLTQVPNMDLQYAQNALLCPCDFPFGRDGILAEGTINTEEVVIGDFDFTALRQARQKGTVRNLQDRRTDLYCLNFQE